MEDQTQNHELSKKSRILILAAVILMIAVVLAVKYTIPGRFTPGGGVAQTLIDQSLAQGKPVMVFFYSEDCRSCREMEKTIDDVFPDFKKTMTLVEVNVLDDKNEELVERTGVHTTPVELFIDGQGAETLVLDVMSAEDLRAQLEKISGGTP
jgi:thiol-disulfide isomerase/thioredoxin